MIYILRKLTLSIVRSPFYLIKFIQIPTGYLRPATKVGRNAEGNSRIEKLAEGTDQAGDNEAAQEQVEVGEVRRRSVVFFPLAQFITQHEGGEV